MASIEKQNLAASGGDFMNVASRFSLFATHSCAPPNAPTLAYHRRGDVGLARTKRRILNKPLGVR